MRLKIALIVVGFLICCAAVLYGFTFCWHALKHDRNYLVFEIYDKNYPEIYRDTFDIMFDNNWEVISESTQTEWTIPEIPSVDKSTRYQHTLWNIQYFNSDGEKSVFVVDNKIPLKYQIQRHIQNLISAYFKKYYTDNYFNEINGITCCFFTSMGNVYIPSSVTGADAANDNMKKYIDTLETPEGAIDFTNITPNNIFEMCPIYFRIDLNVNYNEFSLDNTETLLEYRQELLYEINAFVGNKLNADASCIMHSHMEGREMIDFDCSEYNSYYISGEFKTFDYDWQFKSYFYANYQNKFWD